MEHRLDSYDGKVWLDGKPIAEFMKNPNQVMLGDDDFESMFTRLLDIGYHPLTNYLDGVMVEKYRGKPEVQAKNLWKWLDLYNTTSKHQLIEIKKNRKWGNMPSVRDCALQWYRLFCIINGNKVDILEVMRDIYDTPCTHFVSQERSAESTLDNYFDSEEDDPRLAFAGIVFSADISNGFVYLNYYKDFPVLKVLDEEGCRIVFEENGDVPVFGSEDVWFTSLWGKLLSKISNANKMKNDVCYKMAQ